MESISTANPSPVIPSAKPELHFRLAAAWGHLGILFLCMLVAGIALVLFTIPFGHSFTTESPVMKLLLYVVPFLLFALYLKKEGELGKMLQPEASIKRVPGIVYLLLLLFIPAVQIALDPIVNLIPMPDFVREMFEKQLGGKDIFTFITIVVAAPVLEEFLMRGLLLRGLLKNYSPAKAIVWTSVMFAVLHLNPWQGIGAFILGLVLGWIYYKTRSIWTCIFLHFANNLFASLMMLTLPEGVDISASLYDVVGNPLWYGLLYGAALVVLAFCIFSLKRQLNSLPLKYE